MRLETFEMERLQSTWEHRVAWNVSESGVHPLRVEELADTQEARAAVLAQDLVYTQTNGTSELRSAIARLYPDAGPDNIQVTNGGSEANLVTLLHLIQPGDDVVMMTPNYMQVHGLAKALGASVRKWPLILDETGEAPRWRVDVQALASLVTDRTRVILICNPNNPTGMRADAAVLDAIAREAARVGAWIVSDEIYRGAELDNVETPSMWGRSDRVIVTSGLSKAYGLPGLRIGWLVAAPDVAAATWAIHDYTTIGPGAVNDCLARLAFVPSRHARLIARTRGILRTNYPVVRKWIERRAPLLSHAAPDAGAIVFVRYRHGINSTLLVERLRDEQSVLVVPGDHFGMDGFLRIGFGSDPAHLLGSLERIGEMLDSLSPAADAR